MKSKTSRNQQQVYAFLENAQKELSAQDIHIALRQVQKKMGLATVYRALQSLHLQGKVQARVLANGETVYGAISQAKHHLNCLNCGLSIPLESYPVEGLQQALGQTNQFRVYYHTLEFFGLCRPCSRHLGAEL